MMTLRLKDEKFAPYLEDVLGAADLEAFVCEDIDDSNTLMNCLRENEKLFKINVAHSGKCPMFSLQIVNKQLSFFKDVNNQLSPLKNVNNQLSLFKNINKQLSIFQKCKQLADMGHVPPFRPVHGKSFRQSNFATWNPELHIFGQSDCWRLSTLGHEAYVRQKKDTFNSSLSNSA